MTFGKVKRKFSKGEDPRGVLVSVLRGYWTRKTRRNKRWNGMDSICVYWKHGKTGERRPIGTESASYRFGSGITALEFELLHNSNSYYFVLRTFVTVSYPTQKCSRDFSPPHTSVFCLLSTEPTERTWNTRSSKLAPQSHWSCLSLLNSTTRQLQVRKIHLLFPSRMENLALALVIPKIRVLEWISTVQKTCIFICQEGWLNEEPDAEEMSVVRPFPSNEYRITDVLGGYVVYLIFLDDFSASKT